MKKLLILISLLGVILLSHYPATTSANSDKQRIFLSFVIFDCLLYFTEIGEEKHAAELFDRFGYLVSKQPKITHFDKTTADAIRNDEKIRHERSQFCPKVMDGKKRHYVKDHRTKKVLGQAGLYIRLLEHPVASNGINNQKETTLGVSDKLLFEYMTTFALIGAVESCGYDASKVSNYKHFTTTVLQIKMLESGLKYGADDYNLLLKSVSSSTLMGAKKIKDEPSSCNNVITAFDIAYTLLTPDYLVGAQQKFNDLR